MERVSDGGGHLPSLWLSLSGNDCAEAVGKITQTNPFRIISNILVS